MLRVRSSIIPLHGNRDAYPLPAVAAAQEVIRQLFQDMRATQAGARRKASLK
jgi:hypothetical protein